MIYLAKMHSNKGINRLNSTQLCQYIQRHEINLLEQLVMLQYIR